MMELKQTILHGLTNIPGWHTKRHIVVFESDDWGAIRMPSMERYNLLKAQGVEIGDGYGYDYNDTLASNDDLELLMDVLSSVKDKNGNPAKITMNCCVANPDFKKIQENDFQKYYYEPFPETLKRYPHHDRSFELWLEGIRNKIFQPQFHGREHLNALMWLRLLQKKVDHVKTSFEKEVYSMNVNVAGEPRTHVLSAFNILQKEDYKFACDSVKEGLDLFELLFGFRSLTMIAPCYTWDGVIEKVALRSGVKVIQGSRVQHPSAYAKTHGEKLKRHFLGQKNKDGQIYLVRSCDFEPTQNKKQTADSCLRQINLDFCMHKPAIVSCHRLNFIGELNPSNRDNNLREFSKLLNMIINKFPDVEFMSSDELGKIILN